MKAFHELLERAKMWVRDRPGVTVLLLTVALLMLGWLAALVLMDSRTDDREFVLGLLTFLGTLASALAAFWAASAAAQSARLTHEAFEHQVKRELKEKQPQVNLMSVYALMNEDGTAYVKDKRSESLNATDNCVEIQREVRLANLNQFSIHVRYVIWRSDEDETGAVIGPHPYNAFLPPNSESRINIEHLRFCIRRRGELCICFQAASTGPKFYSLNVPIKVRYVTGSDFNQEPNRYSIGMFVDETVIRELPESPWETYRRHRPFILKDGTRL